MPDRELIILAKEPVPGRVKTRLAQSIGSESAAELYTRFVDIILRRCASHNRGWAAVLAVTPDDAESRFRACLPRMPACVTFRPQGEGDLGKRLESLVKISRVSGACQVILIGTDNPDLVEEDIAEGFQLLEGVDAAIGPAADGGYYLIGLNASLMDDPGPLFRGVDWSTDRVFSQTINRLESAGRDYATLKRRRDIDRYDDLTVMHRTGDDELRRLIEPYLF